MVEPLNDELNDPDPLYSKYTKTLVSPPSSFNPHKGWRGIDWVGVVAGSISDLNLNSTVEGTLPVKLDTAAEADHCELIFHYYLSL